MQIAEKHLSTTDRIVDVYRVYVVKQRRGGSEVVKGLKTQTPFFSSAKAAFFELYSMDFSKNHLILMTKNHAVINSYRYHSAIGDRNYFDETMELKK